MCIGTSPARPNQNFLQLRTSEGIKRCMPGNTEIFKKRGDQS